MGPPTRKMDGAEITLTLWDKDPDLYGDAVALNHHTFTYLPARSQTEVVHKAMAQAEAVFPNYVANGHCVKWWIAQVYKS